MKNVNYFNTRVDSDDVPVIDLPEKVEVPEDPVAIMRNKQVIKNEKLISSIIDDDGVEYDIITTENGKNSFKYKLQNAIDDGWEPMFETFSVLNRGVVRAVVFTIMVKR